MTISDIVEFLNKAAKLDARAIEGLVNLRVPCNEVIAEHPTIQVAAESKSENATPFLGMLGLLNGVIGETSTSGDKITINYDSDAKFTGFGILTEK